MPSINKKQVKIITTAIKNQSHEINATSTWLGLVAEFSIGKVSGSKILFTRNDYKKWREILISSCGYDPLDIVLSGNRTEVASVTHHEKWASESELAKQLSVTAINSDIITSKGRCSVIPEVEYRVNKDHLNPRDYEACMVVENLEAFIFIHRFNLPTLGRALVLYRGHDVTTRAVNEFLERTQDVPIIGFTDPDPSGLGILNDWSWLNHALVPDVTLLAKAPSLHARFQKQLQARPNIKEEFGAKSLLYQKYANWIVDKGFAGTQEWLCSHYIPLQLLSIR